MNKIITKFSNPISELVKKRYSCRTYNSMPLSASTQRKLKKFIHSLPSGPFFSQSRFELIAATDQDSNELSSLGTYGFIKNAPAYIVGATELTGKNLEDFGYLMEAIILFATDLDLGTCWLGGTFTRSSFAEKIKIADDETIPAVISVGYPASNPRKFDSRIRQTAGSDHRLPWEELFFNGGLSTPLTPAQAGEYKLPLEMVRLAPSASNKQPWRILKTDHFFHFYLRRTPGYLEKFYTKLIKIEDLQRVDIGISLCHFEFTTRDLGLEGKWEIHKETARKYNLDDEYVVSWVL